MPASAGPRAPPSGLHPPWSAGTGSPLSSVNSLLPHSAGYRDRSGHLLTVPAPTVPALLPNPQDTLFASKPQRSEHRLANTDTVQRSRAAPGDTPPHEGDTHGRRSHHIVRWGDGGLLFSFLFTYSHCSSPHQTRSSEKADGVRFVLSPPPQHTVGAQYLLTRRHLACFPGLLLHGTLPVLSSISQYDRIISVHIGFRDTVAHLILFPLSVFSQIWRKIRIT